MAPCHGTPNSDDGWDTNNTQAKGIKKDRQKFSLRRKCFEKTSVSVQTGVRMSFHPALHRDEGGGTESWVLWVLAGTQHSTVVSSTVVTRSHGDAKGTAKPPPVPRVPTVRCGRLTPSSACPEPFLLLFRLKLLCLSSRTIYLIERGG